MASCKKKRNIKDAIYLLASILTECGVPKFPLECFRRAKFDNAEVSNNLWRLIMHIIQLLRFLEEDKHGSSLICGVSHSFLKSSETNVSELSAVVRVVLYSMGYRRPKFYITHVLSSSRELLLAFGWLIHSSDLFHKLSQHYLAASKIIHTPLKSGHQALVERLIENNEKMQFEVKEVVDFLASSKGEVKNIEKTTGSLHRLVWLKQRLDCKWKEVQRTCLAYGRISHEINCFTKPAKEDAYRGGRSGLSIDEVYLLRHPDQMKVHIDKLGRCAKMFEMLVQWQQCEALFWQWMESVVDLQEEEQRKQLEYKEEGDKSRSEVMAESCRTCKEMAAEESQLPDSKEHVSCSEVNKEDLLVKWGLLQHEMKGVFEKNTAYMRKLQVVLKHKTEMLEQLHVNRQQQKTWRLLQCKCPLVYLPEKSTQAVVGSMLEEAGSIDRAGFVAVGGSVAKSAPASVRHYSTAGAEAVEPAHVKEEALLTKIASLDTDMHYCKDRVSSALSAVEEHLPTRLYKLS